jgi:SIR2-like protein
MLDPLTAVAFSIYENKGVYALLVGSGLSRAAEIPTGWEITLDLVRRIGLLRGAGDQPDWAAWYRAEYKEEPEYPDLLDALAQTGDERRAILHRYIEATPEDVEQGRKTPTKAHRSIAQLVQGGFVKVILTTNFDRLLENAIRDAGIEPTIITSDDDLAGAVPLVHSRCYVIKLHGDYLDTRIRNTESELDSYSVQFDRLLDRIFDEYGLIVSGWSGDWDTGLRKAIIRAPNRRFPLFWTARGKPGAAAEDIVRHRSGRFIQISEADAFWTDLAAKVAIQSELQNADPRSVKLLTASAKKYLSSTEYRIVLDDLVREELKRALALTDFPMNAPWITAEFVRRVGRYEAIFEPLAKIFAVLGRWGGDAEFRSVAEIISSLLEDDAIAGVQGYLNLRFYPGILLVYAYGLALFRGRQLALVNSLFRTTVRDRSRGNEAPLVTAYFLAAWGDGADRGLWNQLPEFGGQNRITPLSDHLHVVLRHWLADEFFLPNEFTQAFEEFELLGSLTSLSARAAENELAEMIADQTGHKWVWAPVGRIAWDGAVSRRILAKWKTPEEQKLLLEAGFANGNSSFLEKAMVCLAKIMSRMDQ